MVLGKTRKAIPFRFYAERHLISASAVSQHGDHEGSSPPTLPSHTTRHRQETPIEHSTAICNLHRIISNASTVSDKLERTNWPQRIAVICQPISAAGPRDTLASIGWITLVCTPIFSPPLPAHALSSCQRGRE